MKKLFNYILLYASVALAQHTTLLAQQCESKCNTIIAAVDTNQYILNPGETLCILQGAIAKGRIVLAGGTICNAGVINSGSFKIDTGTINNYGTIVVEGDLSLNANKLLFTNNAGATLNVMGTLSIKNVGIELDNKGTINCTENIMLNAGTITNNGTINYTDLIKTGGKSTNKGNLNCCGR